MPLKNKVNVVTNSDITNNVSVSANVSIKNPIAIRSGGSGDTYTKAEIDDMFSEVDNQFVVVNNDIAEINTCLEELGPSIEEIPSESECDNRTTQWYRIRDVENESNYNPFFVTTTHIEEQTILTQPNCPSNGTDLTAWSRLINNFDGNFTTLFAEQSGGISFSGSYVFSAKYSMYEETEEVEDPETGETIIQPVGDLVDFYAIRIGAGSKVGELVLPSLKGKQFKITIGHYFSYNAVTYEKIYDENLNEVQIGNNTFELYNKPTTYDVISDGDYLNFHTMGNGRFFLYDISVVDEEHDEIEHKEVASKDDLENLKTEYIDPLYADVNSLSDDINNVRESVTALDEEVTIIQENMGDIQIFEAYRLPEAGAEYVNKLFRVKGIIYQCVLTGKGSEKIYNFDNLNGSSEITMDNWDAAAGEVGNGFDEDFYATDLLKVFRNNNDGLKLGSSKAFGHFNIERNPSELPCTKIELVVKNYSSSKNADCYVCINPSIIDEDYILEPGETRTLTYTGVFDLSESPLNIELSSDPDGAQGFDNRIIIKSLKVKLGENTYEWQEVIGGGEGGERLSYEEAMDILEPFEIVGNTLRLSGSSTISGKEVHLGYSADVANNTIVIGGEEE